MGRIIERFVHSAAGSIIFLNEIEEKFPFRIRIHVEKQGVNNFTTRSLRILEAKQDAVVVFARSCGSVCN